MRTLRLGIALAALVLALCAPARAEDRPDLVPSLPEAPHSVQVAPFYVDAYEAPGRLLYRFDAILANQGGTLDIQRDPSTGNVRQAVWDGGVPSTAPDPDDPPPTGPDVEIMDLDAAASFAYVVEPDHAHWHFFDAARYELLLPGGGARVSDKIGFCLFDTFNVQGGTLYFGPLQDWCGYDHPVDDFVRMGLSPGSADLYRSQVNFQWVDVTGLAPGRYALRATANPLGHMVESDTANNALDQERTVPGVTAEHAQAHTRVPAAVGVPLSGAVVGAEVPARRSAECEPSPSNLSCYLFGSEQGPLAFRVTRPPANGELQVGPGAGTRATATYTPRRGFAGTDSFDYVATDARGLDSAPAMATVTVDPALKRLVGAAAIRRRGRRWHAVLRLSQAARVWGRVYRGRRTVKRLRSRRLRAGRRTVALGRLRRAGRHRLRLRIRSGNRSQTITLRFGVGR